MLPYLTVECQPQEVIQVSTMNWCRQPKEMLPLSLNVDHQHQQMIQVQLRIKVVNLDGSTLFKCGSSTPTTDSSWHPQEVVPVPTGGVYPKK